MRVYAIDFEHKQAWKVVLTGALLRRYDNGHLVSIGLTVGTEREDIRPSLIAKWVVDGIAVPVDYDEANHGGCQSACVRRGNPICRW